MWFDGKLKPNFNLTNSKQLDPVSKYLRRKVSLIWSVSFSMTKKRDKIDTSIATIFLSDGDEKVESNNHWDECARL